MPSCGITSARSPSAPGRALRRTRPPSTAGSAGSARSSGCPTRLPTFVTPAFAGYISGHSTFSRAAAEVLTAFTGSSFFPGGLYEWRVPAGSLAIEGGPSEDVRLQWATYFDAADAAGISRLYMGIHVLARRFRRAEGGFAVRPRARGLSPRVTSTERSMRLDQARAMVDAVLENARRASVGLRRGRPWRAGRGGHDGRGRSGHANQRAAKGLHSGAQRRALDGRVGGKGGRRPGRAGELRPVFTFFKGGFAAFEDGRQIGAIGVSGLPGEEDEQLALEAIARAGLSSE